MTNLIFDRTLDLVAGTPDKILPGVRRVLAPNPGPMTFKGTVSYIIGQGSVAIIDPGPDDESHVAALLAAVRGETVTHIFVTHTHRDHSPATAALKRATGAQVLAEGPHRAARPLFVGEAPRSEAAADTDFMPDTRLADGDVVEGRGWALEAVATPGHTANHMGYVLREPAVHFCGDHVMGWSTTVVAPPDGAMADYMASLEKLWQRDEDVYLPGHGNILRNARGYVHALHEHRRDRESAILAALMDGAADIPALVRAIYIGLDERLVPAAGRSVLAHLEDLVSRGLVITDGAPSIMGTYRLT
jgi:glyoxylase-like metal-dependent hydrolase (beta-lactamase superfamily II)